MRRWLGYAVSAACACASKVDSTEEGGGTGEGTMAAESSGVGSSTEASTNASTTSTTSAGTTASSSGLDPDGFAELCAAQGTSVACEGIDPFDPGDGTVYWCYWEAWIPAELVDGACVFADASEAGCSVASASRVGCASGNLTCIPEQFGQWRASARGGVELALVGSCFPTADLCEYGVDGTLVNGPPECDCLCTREFPG